MDNQKLISMFQYGMGSYHRCATGHYLANKLITAFFPMEGAKYRNKAELMVVGRSANGWVDKDMYSANSLGDPTILQAMLNEIFNHHDPEDPMALIKIAWNRDENPFWRSAFFRVAKKISTELEIVNEANEEWASYLVWSNLYKISPYEGGNPKLRMQRAQEPWCFDFLREEITIYKPKRILFMTGNDWANPFLEHIHFDEKKISKDDCVELCGEIKMSGDVKTYAVVIPHPQGKTEQEPVEQAAECFKLLIGN